MEVEKIKKGRAETLRANGWSNPWELLSGAVETSGMVFKRADVLGVGAATGMIVGAGAAGVGAAGRAVNTIGKASFAGVNTVIGVGSDVSKQTGRLLLTSVGTSTRAVSGVATGVAGGVVHGAKYVTVVAKPVTKVVTGTAKSVGAIASTTGRVLAGAAGVATFGLLGSNRSATTNGKVAAVQTVDKADPLRHSSYDEECPRPVAGLDPVSRPHKPNQTSIDAHYIVVNSIDDDCATKLFLRTTV